MMHGGEAENDTLKSIEHFPILTWTNRSSHWPDDWIVPLESLIAAHKLRKEVATRIR
jgi:hypothetical protein